MVMKIVENSKVLSLLLWLVSFLSDWFWLIPTINVSLSFDWFVLYDCVFVDWDWVGFWFFLHFFWLNLFDLFGFLFLLVLFFGLFLLLLRLLRLLWFFDLLDFLLFALFSLIPNRNTREVASPIPRVV